MSAANQVYLLDAGNSQIKLALAQDGVIQQVERFDSAKFNIQKRERNIPIACSSVINEKLLQDVRAHFTQVFEISTLIDLPFDMAYNSPETLGIDRLCNAAAMSQIHLGKPRLAIDLGTCIKFDFLDADGFYHGGSIGPGLQMRSKAMAHFTAKLPEIKAQPTDILIGKNTKECLEIGSYFGWQKEIEGIWEAYRSRFPNLATFLTGGDAPHFDLGQKNGIFVHENLTLEGILALYLTND
ncbi:MAG: type III pantothenate kinase [Sphingomonadales bacterium]|nr:type III pantothenate kinase [Sphingomonadales bacterium]